MLGTRVSDLTTDELKTLVREAVEQTLLEFLADPDKGLELRQSMKVALERSIRTVREGGALYSAGDIAKDIGTELVARMTKEELRQMIETSVEYKLIELFGDPDDGLILRESIRKRLSQQIALVARGERGKSLEDVVEELGLN